MRPEIVPITRNGRSFIESARRAQIVECAIDTIATVGYSRTSLAQIAKRASISKGVISYHFADKDDLIQQVVTEVLQAFDAYMRPRVEAERGSATAMLRAYIESNVAFMTAHRKHVLVLVIQLGVDHPPTRDDTVPLGFWRQAFGLVSLGIPVLCFTPILI